MDLGLNGTVETPALSNTIWVRVDAYRNGKGVLRGENSQQ